jgi:hypothetical protein
MDYQFQSGDTAAGFATLEAAPNARAPWVYRLPCLEGLDEVRHSPHYRAILARVGAISSR